MSSLVTIELAPHRPAPPLAAVAPVSADLQSSEPVALGTSATTAAPETVAASNSSRRRFFILVCS